MLEPAPLRASSSLRDRLVVEDGDLLAQDLRSELEEVGAEVLGPAPTVAGTLALLATEAPPDAAIRDVNPGCEMVFPVADLLRERGVPVMFATGHDGWALSQAYEEVPRCGKPFDVGQRLGTLFG